MSATIEAVVGTPISFVIAGPPATSPSDALLYLNGVASGTIPTITQIGTSTCWKVTFTPASTGVYSLYAFSAVQLTLIGVARSSYSFLANIEDEALGSWTWDKISGVLTVLRQNGTVMATHNIIDSQATASRERVS